MTPSPKQLEVLLHAVDKRTMLFAVGATRSGKSWAAAASYARWLRRCGGGFDHVVAGRTSGTAYRNVVVALEEHLRDMGVPHRWHAQARMLEVASVGGIARVYVLGANDRTAREKIQGATLKSLHIDEFPLLDRDFWPLAQSRLSVDNAKIWATANPEGPLHWAKKEVVDRIDDFDGRVVHFDMEDNPALSDEAKNRIKAGLQGHWYDRLAEGKWAGASGVIFPSFDIVDKDAVPENPRWRIGFDWGAASVTAGVLLACEPSADDRWPERAVVTSEFHWDARELQTISDEEMLRRIQLWLAAQVPSARPSEFNFVVDPATHAGFKLLLRRAGFKVRDAHNEVLPGIAATNARLTAGNVSILRDKCPNLERELASYSWDAKAVERGDDRPMKVADHSVDALRYYCHSRKSGYAEWRERQFAA